MGFPSNCLLAARQYHAWGYCALALCPPDHTGVGSQHRARCKKPGKVPLGRHRQYQQERCPLWRLEADFRNVPTANVGVMMGKVSGLVGVDIDSREGYEALCTLAGGELPATPSFATHRGLRLLFAVPAAEEDPTGGTLCNGLVEVLGRGLQSVMPPSRHQEGSIYCWSRGRDPQSLPLAPLPEYLRPGRAVLLAGEGSIEGVPIKHLRNQTLFRMGCSLRRFGAGFEEVVKCLLEANRRCVPMLSSREVHQISKNVMRYRPQNGL